jgi:DNA-binding NtrC family response regulator/nitrogen-specific signal transduction histidine kinase
MPDTILVMDDDRLTQKAIYKLLKDRFYEVLLAGSLAEARSLLNLRQVSVVLADLLLPDGSGTEIVEYARRVDERLPVIVLTSRAQTESVVEAIRQGAMDYLEKPIDRERLLAVVEKALGQRRKRGDSHAAAHPLHVLVIDDDLVLLKVMSNWLAQLGAVVQQASHLEEARQILAEFSIDLVVSDIYLDGGTGLELVPQIRQLGDPPLILVTADRDTSTAIQALREGVFDFLQKPLNREELINSVLRARQYREAMKEKHRLEREKEEYRVRLELLSASLEARVKEQVEEVLQAQSFATSIYRGLPSGLVITDREQRVTAVNPAGERLLNTPADLLVGRLARDHPRLSTCSSTIAEVLRTGKTYTDMEIEVSTSSGDRQLLGYTVAPLIGASDNLLAGTITHLVDLTSKRSLEEYKAQSERLVSLGMMAGGMAHEINNPLTVIVGWLEYILQKEQVSPGVEQALSKCLHSAVRCGELVGAMLNLSRRTPTKVARVDVHAALRRVMGLIEKQLALHHVEPISQLAATHSSIFGDERELEQLFLNLLLNARDAMPHGGKLFISTQNEEDGLMVRIADTGIGVPQDRLPHLFTPFYTTKDAGQGTGLGLAICVAIVERHRGRIDASSEVGRGTTMSVLLPAMASPAEPEPSDEGPLPRLAPLRIAVVDDDADILALCDEALTRGGHRVYPFPSATSCLEWLAENTVDMLVTDVKMPVMDGVDLHAKIQQVRPGLRTLFITGSVVGHTLERLKGSDDVPVRVLRKPFRMDQLYRSIARVLGPAAGSGPATGSGAGAASPTIARHPAEAAGSLDPSAPDQD